MQIKAKIERKNILFTEQISLETLEVTLKQQLYCKLATVFEVKKKMKGKFAPYCALNLMNSSSFLSA